MLKSLSITNFAVIKQLQLDFESGLSVITGETGAGKSIIIDALSLLLGSRATTDMIRTGEGRAVVEGVFELQSENYRESFENAGLTRDAQDIIVRREVHSSGRSRVFIDDQTVSASFLRELSVFLVDIYGQGEQLSLGATRVQLELLDEFAGCEQLRQRVAEAYYRRQASLASLADIRKLINETNRTRDYLEYQFQEIEKINPLPDEDYHLRNEKLILTNSEKAAKLSGKIYAELYEDDDSVLSKLGYLSRSLGELSAINENLVNSSETLENSIEILRDIAETVRDSGSKIDFSMQRLDEIENRLTELERIKRKYGIELKDLAQLKTDLQNQLAEYGDLPEREEVARASLHEAEQGYVACAALLSQSRHAAASSYEKLVVEDLSTVALERAQFKVCIETYRHMPQAESAKNALTPDAGTLDANDSYWSPNGADKIEFLFSANSGEDVRPLARVASGGELSRLMLTLRNVSRNKSRQSHGASSQTLVFDEIDAGISGRVAEAVGRRLGQLASKNQVLCITHQPQIARFAASHFVVSKDVENGRAVTSIRRIEYEERIGELARLIGAEDVATAHETARWLLDTAKNEPDKKLSIAAQGVKRKKPVLN